MGTLWQDLMYGLRMLAKCPGFTLVAVLALALGIGANTALFSVVDAVILRPLPFPAPDRLVAVWSTNQQRGELRTSASYPDFADWRSLNHAFERIAAFHTNDFTLTGTDEPAHILGAVVSADLFRLLGVAPKLGRDFLSEEDDPGKTKVRPVILSYAFWRSRFGSDPQVIEKTVQLDSQSYTIVGVMPGGFQFPLQGKPIDLWTSFLVDEIASDNEPITAERGAHYLSVIARLKPDVRLPQAQAEMDTIASALAHQYPDTDKYRGIALAPELERLVGDVRPALLILFGAVGCVLLIACVNVANLLLARAAARQKEIAIRSTLGAGRLRLVRQLLTECILLAALGGALGLALAWWGSDLLLALSPENVPRLSGVHLSGHVLAFTAFASLLTGLVFGLLPALHVSRSDLAESLKESGRGSTESARRSRLRSALVVAETALALVPLVGAGLLIQSLSRLEHVKPGFDPHNVLTFNLGLPDARYSYSQQAAFFEQLLPRIRALPGVRSASAVSPLPLSGDDFRVTFEIEGRPVAKSDQPATNYREAAAGYFQTMHIPLLEGRDFSDQDNLKSPPVIIVNQTFAKQFFPGEDPIGKHIKPGLSSIPGTHAVMREIVGVVGDVKHRSLNREAGPEVYEPESQMPFETLTLVVRTEGDPRGLIGAVREQVKALDKDLPIYDVKLMEEYLSTSVAQPRFNTMLLAIFAGVALVLAAVGLYGVMSYSVVQRTHEIGIRMALGAQQKDVLRMIVGQALRLTLVGTALGLAGAWAATRLMSGLLFGVKSSDPITYAGVALLLSAVALLACYVPAYRAMRVDPMVALRYE
jgi:putative ABC transport system permease protein